VKSDTLAGQRYPLDRPRVIGRSDDADIIIDDGYASEFHVRVGVQEREVMLNDVGSTNGTYLNGRRVSVPTVIGKGDSIQIGKTIFEVQ
jgi:pSer/pThr/pTyr-binding forkhead associated (FHA) protein